MNKCKIKTIGFMILVLLLLSLSLFVIKRIIFFFVARTDFSDYMASMVSMIILTSIILRLSRKAEINLSIFPDKFTVSYISVSIISVVLFIASPSNYKGGIEPILLLVYSSIVTPIFEELIFRGYIWNELNQIFTSEWKTYIITTILFALWHLGYISSIAFRVEDDLLNVMIWKVITGLCFGIVLGAVRLKTKNCYSTMILHGVMNLFGR
ncbi:CAAX amino protease [Clostridioides difficile]|uniref:CPBP family intramembrane glutamic endopeptidase n=1 Tax=Clostridioides difficile TaxID=1496 RepID=UPI0010251E20|nr:CPBP family intramembrane glutamic endopeptidase [Clostridioides difficile]VFE54868.1 CAAX amino protease [Clostridioides difficile]VIH42882.1 CAAX amino protease [Clostridioides difficile]